jgi:hypothetical protein
MYIPNTPQIVQKQGVFIYFGYIDIWKKRKKSRGVLGTVGTLKETFNSSFAEYT